MDTVGTYKYKKWTICGKNDYNKEWFLEPNFLLEMFSDKDETFLINFINNHRIYDESMTTLLKTKQFIKEHDKELKEQIMDEFMKELTKFQRTL